MRFATSWFLLLLYSFYTFHFFKFNRSLLFYLIISYLFHIYILYYSSHFAPEPIAYTPRLHLGQIASLINNIAIAIKHIYIHSISRMISYIRAQANIPSRVSNPVRPATTPSRWHQSLFSPAKQTQTQFSYPAHTETSTTAQHQAQ